MYLFPTITLSKKAIAAAKSRSLSPDALYALELLEATGEFPFPFQNTPNSTTLT